ncbi:DUF421 domain-containing protein [Litchfieldia salsa]|uniref:Uncharacterized membrane protein YcaP, DUF421 family n=1 Tax=Litchfieldia salsa TaxID=930152 RepID=A0A1H0V5N1_9BACI|nr:DUF421 domain-containing protein [Litchfieldia salsa]SDP73651.1 Uncharacterized membrane protein YcaP, DUF421 family [Litchfieldia salsa]
MELYIAIVARTLFLYVLIVIIFRLMGKREIGELSILDLVVFIMIAEMAVQAIESPEDPLLHTIFPMIILMSIQILLAYISLKSQKFREIMDGKPAVIINQGKIDEEEMKKQRYNFDDLLIQLRDKNVKNVSDVEFAILEPSGKLSVLEKNKKTLEWPLILDGKVQEENLGKINKTNLWLRQQLRELGHRDLKQISYCTYTNGTLFIDLKDEK